MAHLRTLAQFDMVLETLPEDRQEWYLRVHKISLQLLQMNTAERTAQAVVLRVLGVLAINKSLLVRTTLNASIFARKYCHEDG